MGEGKVILQVADEPHEREAGLMYRTSLAPDEGMIFIFPDVRYLSFWMKNTYIPLDIVFVSADGRVLNIEQMAARDLRGHESAGPAKYAIELPLGAARRLKLEKGMQLDIPENARIAAE